VISRQHYLYVNNYLYHIIPSQGYVKYCKNNNRTIHSHAYAKPHGKEKLHISPCVLVTCGRSVFNITSRPDSASKFKTGHRNAESKRHASQFRANSRAGRLTGAQLELVMHNTCGYQNRFFSILIISTMCPQRYLGKISEHVGKLKIRPKLP
jgi:hypothetical protein